MTEIEKALQYIAELEERVRIQTLELHAHHKLEGDGVVMVQSLVSHRNQRPRVDIQIGQVHAQLDAEHAIEVARSIMNCAVGAYADAFLTWFLQDKVGLDLQRAAQVLVDFREYREKLAIELQEDEK